MEKIKIFLCATLCLPVFMVVMTSCNDENYLCYDENYSGLYFTNDTMRYSFGVTPAEVRTMEYRIPVALMGKPSDSDRTFSYRIEMEHTSAEYGVQYEIREPVIRADSIQGYIPIVLNRDELKGDHKSGYVRYRLDIRLVKDNQFTPTLSPADEVCVLYFDNAVEQPNWLDADGNKIWTEYRFGKWHPLKYIKMVEFYQQIANIQPETYKNMVEIYGEYLEKVPYGDPHTYMTIMKKYVYKPMYDYFNDPANKTDIESLYPDFPFDFPDPYNWIAPMS